MKPQENSFSQRLCSIYKLQAYIRVLDMNEHRPVFLKPLYEVRVEESSSRFTFQYRVKSFWVSYCSKNQ